MKIPIIRLEVVVERDAEYLREPLTCPGKAAKWADENIVRHSNREHIIAACCDSSGKPTCIDIVGKGTADCCISSVPEIFKAAIISNATTVILFHNHPSGEPRPSKADRELTERAREAGELLQIRLTDHIIIGSNGKYYSFWENNELCSNGHQDEYKKEDMI